MSTAQPYRVLPAPSRASTYPKIEEAKEALLRRSVMPSLDRLTKAAEVKTATNHGTGYYPHFMSVRLHTFLSL